MPPLLVSPLPAWNVRGYSYAERQQDGQLHPGADLNVGYGDDDLGLPVLCIAGGTVVHHQEWDGSSYGYGTFGLVRHQLGGLPLWSLYAHLDSLDPSFRTGAAIVAGQPVGACGRTGRQRWAHLHLELRYAGPPDLPASFWGGTLDPERLSQLYADPYTLLRVLGALDTATNDAPTRDDLSNTLSVMTADRDRNYSIKMELEHYLRSHRLYLREGRRFVPTGDVADQLIARATAAS